MIVIRAYTVAASAATFTLLRDQAVAAFACLRVRVVTLMMSRLNATARRLLVYRISAAVLICVCTQCVDLVVPLVFTIELFLVSGAVVTAVFTLVITAVPHAAFATIFGASPGDGTYLLT